MSASASRLAGLVHHQRQLAQVTFLLLRDASGIAPGRASRTKLVRALGAGSFPRRSSRSRASVVASRAGAGGRRAARPDSHRCLAAEVAPPFELRRPRAERAAADAARPRGRVAAPPADACRVRARGGIGRRLPRRRSTRAGFTEIHTPKIVGVGDRERRQRVPARLLRAARRTSRRARSSTSR